MKLLVFTQFVDKADPVMGFFHNWILKLSKKVDRVTVICLFKGEYDLPENVKVLSLGKEEGPSRIKYVYRFYKYIFSEWKNYDRVFVHMNQEYILLGGILWRIFGKKIFMWRNHSSGSFLTDVAGFLCNRVFCTSPFSYTNKFKKTKLMPVGIDTDKFNIVSGVNRKDRSIILLGRVSPIKGLHLVIDAFNILHKRGVKFEAKSIGEPLEEHRDYHNSLLEKASELREKGVMSFDKGIPNHKVPEVFSQYELFINASPQGLFDKTIFEAMACGAFSLVSNISLKDELGEDFIFSLDNIEDLADKIERILNLDREEKLRLVQRNREFVVNNHSLSKLMEELVRELK